MTEHPDNSRLAFWILSARKHQAEALELTERLGEVHVELDGYRSRADVAEQRRREAELALDALQARFDKLAADWESTSAQLARLEVEQLRAQEQPEAPVVVPIASRTSKASTEPRPQAAPRKGSPPRHCKACGNPFHPDFHNRTYCGPDCSPPGKRRTR